MRDILAKKNAEASLKDTVRSMSSTWKRKGKRENKQPDRLQEAKIGEEELESLVIKHTGLVRRIAYVIWEGLPANIDFDDLVQSGMIGLVEAIRRYKEEIGASFSTYAGIRIRGEILDEIRRSDWVPRSVVQKIKIVNIAINELEQKLGRESTFRERADYMKVDYKEYAKIANDIDRIPIYHNLDPDDLTQPSHESEQLQHLLDCELKDVLYFLFSTALTPKEEMAMSYILDGFNLKQTGSIMGVTESRICQHYGSVVKKLQMRMFEYELNGKVFI